MRPTIDVHIEELVLTGFPRGSTRAIGEAVQRHLTQLFTEHGVPAPMQHSIETPRVDAGSFTVGVNTRPGVVGAQIANAVYGVSRR